MKAAHFLFTFDPPLSPHKPAKKEKIFKKRKREVRRWWGGYRREERQKERRRKREKWGAGKLHLFSPPYLLSPSLLFSFCLWKQELGGQSLCHVEPLAGPPSPLKEKPSLFLFLPLFLLLDRCVLGSALALSVRTGKLTDKGWLNRRRWENKQDEDPKKRKKIKTLQVFHLQEAFFPNSFGMLGDKSAVIPVFQWDLQEEAERDLSWPQKFLSKQEWESENV